MKKVLFVSLLFLQACSPDASLLKGQWKAAAFYQEGQTVQTPLDTVSLEFNDNGSYSFRSIGNYYENGKFRLAGSYLYLTDQSVEKPKERAVKVVYLSKDTLKIEMQAKEHKQTLFFARN